MSLGGARSGNRKDVLHPQVAMQIADMPIACAPTQCVVVTLQPLVRQRLQSLQHFWFDDMRLQTASELPILAQLATEFGFRLDRLLADTTARLPMNGRDPLSRSHQVARFEQSVLQPRPQVGRLRQSPHFDRLLNRRPVRFPQTASR